MGSAHLSLPQLLVDDEEIGRYAVLLDSLGIGLEVFAPDGTSRHRNAKAAELYGDTGHVWIDANGEVVSVTNFPVSEVVGTSHPVFDRTLNLARGRSPWIAVKVSALPVYAPDGALSRVLLILARLSDPNQNALHDPASGIFNQSHALFLLDNEIHRARRYGTPFTLALIDMDRYTAPCETVDRISGDDVFTDVARLISRSMREIDIAGHFGPSGMLLVLPNVALKDAMVGLERLRLLIEASEFSAATSRITISGGVSEYTGENSAPLIERCSSLLDQARQGGGNRFCIDLGLI